MDVLLVIQPMVHNPNGVRGRCRGRGTRASRTRDGNRKDQDTIVEIGTTYYCTGKTATDIDGGGGGTGGNGGNGRGWSNRNIPMSESAPHTGNSGNSGNTNTCGGPPMVTILRVILVIPETVEDTGDQASSGNAGRAIQKKGASVNYYTDNTVKGKIKDI